MATLEENKLSYKLVPVYWYNIQYAITGDVKGMLNDKVGRSNSPKVKASGVTEVLSPDIYKLIIKNKTLRTKFIIILK